MALEQNIQEIFFASIKQKLKANYSLVHEVSETLKISYDSAYRRLRGEKQLSLEEAFLLSQKFNISLDALFKQDEHFQSFNCFHVEPQKFRVEEWLNYLFSNLKKIVDLKPKQIIYAAKDPPIFNYIQFPEITAFKFFFWEKTLFKSEELKERTFTISYISPEINRLCKDIFLLSLKVPITEIWNEDTFRILIRQIEYYWVSGFFNSKDDLVALLDSIERWLTHNKKEAEFGLRFFSETGPKGTECNLHLYENEIVINDNSILVELEDSCIAYITYNVLGLLGSSNPSFCNGFSKFYKAIISKSNLISQVGEKERNRFFNKLQHIVEQFKLNHL